MNSSESTEHFSCDVLVTNLKTGKNVTICVVVDGGYEGGLLLSQETVETLGLAPVAFSELVLANRDIQYSREYESASVELEFDDASKRMANVLVHVLCDKPHDYTFAPISAVASTSTSTLPSTPPSVAGQKRTRTASLDLEQPPTAPFKSLSASPSKFDEHSEQLLGYAALHLLGVKQDFEHHRLLRRIRMRI